MQTKMCFFLLIAGIICCVSAGKNTVEKKEDTRPSCSRNYTEEEVKAKTQIWRDCYAQLPEDMQKKEGLPEDKKCERKVKMVTCIFTALNLLKDGAVDPEAMKKKIEDCAHPDHKDELLAVSKKCCETPKVPEYIKCWSTEKDNLKCNPRKHRCKQNKEAEAEAKAENGEVE